jgi:predicted alpha/beta-hydrolase family hydrolase
MRIVLAHGASGSAASMQPHVDGLRRRGIDALAIDLPVRKAETALGAYRSAAGLDLPDAPPTVIGGHSYGGRVASLVAADADVDADVAVGLVLMSYPLHRPGEPAWEDRTSHWPGIRVPVLLLSGESDPFARTDLLRHAVEARLADAELVTYPRLGHTLRPVLEDVLDRIALFVNRR